MNKKYLFLALLMLLLATGLLILPERHNFQQMKAENLMWEVVQPTRYVTVDQVAMMIIDGDPTLELVDVRPINDFATFSLKNAINIPFDSLLNPNYQGYLGIEDMNVVFYSNDDIRADQSWVIARRMGYHNLYVMKGGLNSWIECIIKPLKPDETASLNEFEDYEFRKGASIYFTGAKLESSDKKSSVNVVRRKKGSAVAGGC
ncbi:MAG: rhodanese-like domain-containing protein [Bacteroidetes bacterium]|nr:rhodanese-like domain-containing protein [Bacteroidota bacterium]MBL6944182.1 rhodanese-like domain-containing protein [Bacteroidales bacterium]